MKKYYTEEELQDKFEKLSYKKQVTVLENALSYMQQANWRTREYCIALGMGYDLNENSEQIGKYVKL